MEIKYSIIIPNRNNFSLLQRALDSIPDDESIEVIVVDDNSDFDGVDKSLYPGYDRQNVSIIFTKEGKGAGYARNVGLSKANGKWVLFLDSDDFFEPLLLQKLNSHYLDDEDIVYFNVCACFSKTLTFSSRLAGRIDKLHSMNDIERDFYCRYKYTEPWGKMIKRDFVERNQIFFDETICANDYMFSIKTGTLAGKIKFCDIVLLCVTERDGSLSHSYFDSEEKWKTRVGVTHNVQKFLDQNNIDIKPFYSLIVQAFKIKGKYRSYIMNFCKEHDISYMQIFYNCVVRTILVKLKLKAIY